MAFCCQHMCMVREAQFQACGRLHQLVTEAFFTAVSCCSMLVGFHHVHRSGGKRCWLVALRVNKHLNRGIAPSQSQPHQPEKIRRQWS